MRGSPVCTRIVASRGRRGLARGKMHVSSQEAFAAKLDLGLIFSSVANKQQDQNHSNERDESSGDQNRIERVGGRGGTCIGQPSDQFEGDDCPNSRAGSA